VTKQDATRSHARRITFFVAIGLVNTAIDISAFACLYELAGLGVVSSNVLAFLLAVSNSYVMNRLITFADKHSGRGTTESFVRFVTVAVVAMAASTAVVYLASQVMHPLIGKLIATAVSTFINYIGIDRFVFSAEGNTAAPGSAHRGSE
jgi:putative flippase GtrA